MEHYPAQSVKLFLSPSLVAWAPFLVRRKISARYPPQFAQKNSSAAPAGCSSSTSLHKIARHMRIGRRTIAKYLEAPAAKAAHRDRASKLDPFKPIIAELLQQDPDANAPLIAQRLNPHGYDGGFTIIKDYLRTLRKNSVARRAYIRVEPAPGERFDVDWGHFGALVYNGAMRKLYAFCLVESRSRKMYLEFTHSQTFETFARYHIHAFQFFSGTSREIWFDNLATAVAYSFFGGFAGVLSKSLTAPASKR